MAEFSCGYIDPVGEAYEELEEKIHDVWSRFETWDFEIEERYPTVAEVLDELHEVYEEAPSAAGMWDNLETVRGINMELRAEVDCAWEEARDWESRHETLEEESQEEIQELKDEVFELRDERAILQDEIEELEKKVVELKQQHPMLAVCAQ